MLSTNQFCKNGGKSRMFRQCVTGRKSFVSAVRRLFLSFMMNRNQKKYSLNISKIICKFFSNRCLKTLPVQCREKYWQWGFAAT